MITIQGAEGRFRAEIRFVDTWGVDPDIVLHLDDAAIAATDVPDADAAGRCSMTIDGIGPFLVRPEVSDG